ncbi:hypothetical protein D9619_005339 [Psilocybe cf. subviscida]|uniref:mRNA guanylyltransferase n=1 Tax=Psilocybe cf. subviscida TaxID=2480587 RepID=A0A8H5BW22_9AGAR|nr:hypothetical protein D9619_005339 [Psilocybe cf. subviscida]
MVLLVTSDNEQFNADKDVVERSVLIKNMLEDVGESDQPIPLPNVSSSVMKKVLEYCEHHRGEPLPSADSEQSQDETRKRTTDISEWDQKFITVDQEMLFEIILAANYLDIKSLLDVGCKTVANMIKGKTPEEIRKLFNIVNDFTPEEEAQIKKENSDLDEEISVMPIPDLPGRVVPRNSEQEHWLRGQVARLCHLEHDRFPGSQPVSFSVKDLDRLEQQDFWVCEKSDGIRVLFLVMTNLETKDQTTYIIDRHNSYREIQGIYFPHHENPLNPLRSSLIDGELVIDVDPVTHQETMRFLAFDCLAIDDQNVMQRTLDKRYGRLKQWFYEPYQKMIRDHPHVAESQPFGIVVKEINVSYALEKVFNIDMPALQHGSDGLIYTCVSTPYTPGTDTNILKWKPPSENSIDFKLVLRFPPSRYKPSEPDWHAKPLFLLHVWCGGERYEQYDDMYMDDREWEELKKTGEQADDRVVEVHWDPSISRWRMMRFRDDKPHGNHKSVVQNIIQSIADGVEKDALLARTSAIRTAWKARTPPPPQQYQQQQQKPNPAQSMRPPPLPPQMHPPSHQASNVKIEFRYGPLATSRWSKVSGPTVVSGMKR